MNDLVRYETKALQVERELQTLADPAWCQSAAEAILNCYPNGNPPDVAAYLQSLRTLLASFPASVAAKVASMESGIVTRCQFPPSLAEVRSFAEPFWDGLRTSVKREREALKAISDRAGSKSSQAEKDEAVARWEKLKRDMLANMEAQGKIIKRASPTSPSWRN